MHTGMQRVDRGQDQVFDAPPSGRELRRLALARSGSLQVRAPWFTLWLVLRGSLRVDAREGGFQLAASEWIALDQDSRPQLQAGADALVLGMALSPELLREALQVYDSVLYPGQGRLRRGDRLVAWRLWRQAGDDARLSWRSPAEVLRANAFQRCLARAWPELLAQRDRCPGRTQQRKRQVFARLQRVRLYLAGHADRVTSLAELSQLTSFSSWHLSKSFQSAYGETLQAAARRLRMARACRLLEDTCWTVEEVASHCGFGSPSSFARAFRNEIGVSSTRYRSAGRSAAAPAFASAAHPHRAWTTTAAPDRPQQRA